MSGFCTAFPHDVSVSPTVQNSEGSNSLSKPGAVIQCYGGLEGMSRLLIFVAHDQEPSIEGRA